MKQPIDEIIQNTARATAQEVVRLQRRMATTNLYCATERLLRNYKTLGRLVANEEEYMQILERDKSITVAPPEGGTPRDREDVLQERVEERRASYRRTLQQFRELDAVVQQYAPLREFVAIRMYYFGEDAFGNDRGADARQRSWEEISEELEAAGIRVSERTLRAWRTNLVQDMTVALFGVDGAVSVESTRRNKESTKREDSTHEEDQ